MPFDEPIQGAKPAGESQQRHDALAQQVAALQDEITKLQTQLGQVKKEQITYLQNVSHQLVAPLNAIKWHIENLTAGRIRSEDRLKKVLRSIYSQATISVHLAKNFALMSNLEADQTLAAQREPLQPINLKQLMVNLADDFQPLGWDKNVHINVQDAPLDKAPSVVAIKNLISQVFSNILENAIKYSDPLTEVNVSGRYNAKENTVTVSVANRGIPLLPEDAGRLFTRGYRSKQALNVYPAGTGFGLYIAKKIVEIHEGKIAAFADHMGFNVFEVTLPVASLQGKAAIREAKDSADRRR